MINIKKRRVVLDIISSLSHEVLEIAESDKTPQFVWDINKQLVSDSISGIRLGLNILTDLNASFTKKDRETVKIQIKLIEVLNLHEDGTLKSCNGINVGISYSKDLSDLVITAVDFDEELDLGVLESDFNYVPVELLTINGQFNVTDIKSNQGSKVLEKSEIF